MYLINLKVINIYIYTMDIFLIVKLKKQYVTQSKMTFGWTITRGLHRQGQTEAPALFPSTELDGSCTWLSMRFLFYSFPTATFSKDTHREMATRNGSWSQTLPLPLSLPLSFLPNMRILHMVVHFKGIPCFAYVWMSNRPLNYNC